MRKVALDLGLRKVCFCEVREGKVIGRRTVGRLEELEDVLGPETDAAEIAIEACREAWAAMDTLEGWGHVTHLVDTTRVKRLGVGQHGRKTDRVDAEVLARAVETGQLPLAHKLSWPRQQLRHHLSLRGALVEARAKFVNTARGIARAMGQRLPSCETSSFAKRIRACDLDPTTRSLVEPLLSAIETVDAQLVGVELALEQQCLADDTIVRLATVPGVSKIVAATFVSVIDDAKRFRNAHQVESYLGLVPAESSSGGARRLGAITKCGNSHARTMLIEASWCLYRSKGDDPLKLWARNVAKRRGRASIAVVALARKLVGVLWAMWRRSTVYDPAYVASTTATGLHCAAQSTEQQAAAFARAAIKIKRLSKQAQRSVRRKPSTPAQSP